MVERHIVACPGPPPSAEQLSSDLLLLSLLRAHGGTGGGSLLPDPRTAPALEQGEGWLAEVACLQRGEDLGTVPQQGFGVARNLEKVDDRFGNLLFKISLIPFPPLHA